MVNTFIERPGMSQVTMAMPSASVSKRKFLRFIPSSREEQGAARHGVSAINLLNDDAPAQGGRIAARVRPAR